MNPAARRSEYYHTEFAAALRQTAIPLVHLRQNYSGIDTGLHLHEDFYSLYIVYSGRGVHTINGHPYGIARGDIYLTPPGATVGYRDYHQLRVDVLCFQIDLFANEEQTALRENPGFRPLFVTAEAHGTSGGEHRLHLTPTQLSATEIMVREILDELKTPGRESAILTRSQFFRLLARLARWGAPHQAASRESTHPGMAAFRGVELAEVLRYCEERFDEPVSVPRLASIMFLSPSRFSEVFTREGACPLALICGGFGLSMHKPCCATAIIPPVKSPPAVAWAAAPNSPAPSKRPST